VEKRTITFRINSPTDKEKKSKVQGCSNYKIGDARYYGVWVAYSKTPPLEMVKIITHIKKSGMVDGVVIYQFDNKQKGVQEFKSMPKEVLDSAIGEILESIREMFRKANISLDKWVKIPEDTIKALNKVLESTDKAEWSFTIPYD
jgi:hypothetical protein